jgi:hypothetical protein
MVPHTYPANPKLSQWVRRQRYQHRLKYAGKRNTLTDEREILLNQVGFVWDAHQASWDDHYQKLETFYHANGHVQLPVSMKQYDPLVTWCKHQRRQYRRFIQEQQQHEQGGSKAATADNEEEQDSNSASSTMTYERIRRLESIGFEWNPRYKSKSK